jgi:hypothetical protein
MPASRILGIILLAVGIVVIGIAYQSSQSAGDQAKQFFGQGFRDKTNWLFAAGIGSSIAGLIALAIPAAGRKGGFAT